MCAARKFMDLGEERDSLDVGLLRMCRLPLRQPRQAGSPTERGRYGIVPRNYYYGTSKIVRSCYGTSLEGSFLPEQGWGCRASDETFRAAGGGGGGRLMQASGRRAGIYGGRK